MRPRRQCVFPAVQVRHQPVYDIALPYRCSALFGPSPCPTRNITLGPPYSLTRPRQRSAGTATSRSNSKVKPGSPLRAGEMPVAWPHECKRQGPLRRLSRQDGPVAALGDCAGRSATGACAGQGLGSYARWKLPASLRCAEGRRRPRILLLSGLEGQVSARPKMVCSFVRLMGDAATGRSLLAAPLIFRVR
jgi:hypothetical protein